MILLTVKTQKEKSEDYYQIGVHDRRRVPLDTDDGKIKSGTQFGMGDVGLLETETRWSNESFELWRFPGEILRNEAHLGNKTLPRFTALSGCERSKYFVLRLHTHCRERDVELSRLVFPLLLDLLGQRLALGLVLTVEEVGGNSALLVLLDKVFGFLLFERPNRLFHLNLKKKYEMFVKQMIQIRKNKN